jgi:hypothetical protein
VDTLYLAVGSWKRFLCYLARKPNISRDFMYIEINTTIAILQIQYGYLNRIAFLNLVSNCRPEKCGFAAKIRVNPWAGINPSEL